ncbi:uncharacterized protein LOC144617966 [Crassostrea virginica]
MFSDDESQAKIVRYSGSTEKQTIQFNDEASAVVVVNQAGKLRFRYTSHPSADKTEQFEPYGIATDSQSRIFTANSDNHCILNLDTDGQFLRFIENCDLEYPQDFFTQQNKKGNSDYFSSIVNFEPYIDNHKRGSSLLGCSY